MRRLQPCSLRLFTACALLGAALLAGCESMPLEMQWAEGLSSPLPEPRPPVDERSAVSEQPTAQGEAAERRPDVRSQADFYLPGNDRFARQQTTPSADEGPGEYTLNFENTAVVEVVKVILGDLLGENYVVDPGVQGSVTLQSSKPLRREDLLVTLEMLLRMNQAAVVRGPDMYHVVPRESASRGGRTVPQLGGSQQPLPRGYSVLLVPLRFISVAEMEQILEPFLEPGTLLRSDVTRNMLVLAGSGKELEQIVRTVEVFDVDWMQGMSFGLFTPDFVKAEDLAAELEKIFGAGQDGPLANLLRLEVVERLNALLVITPRRAYLERVGDWIKRLDRDSGAVGKRLFVYHVQNGKAADLAAVLSEVFSGEGEAQPIRRAEIAPGLEAAETRSSRAATDAARESRRSARAQSDTEQQQPERPASAAQQALEAASQGRAGAGVALDATEDIRIIADEVNNALVILATAGQYKQVEAALRQLDIAPLQVLIEATIAEVQLQGTLRHGLEWFFRNGVGDAGRSLRGRLDLGADGIGVLTPGFSYALFDRAGDVLAVLNTLANDSRAKIVSSPNLMVLNNQAASIQVGAQVPVTTQQQQATTTDANIINSIEFRDTGVQLSVTPRVNASGLVTMEIEQDVSNVVDQADAASNLTPTISTRNISSTVAVDSGETVVLGGLIQENDNNNSSGVPGIRNVPVVGFFFGTRELERTRTELVVLITPRVVRSRAQAREVTDEFRRKMESLKPTDERPHPGQDRSEALGRALDTLEQEREAASEATLRRAVAPSG
ncbi:MAG: type II secretion system secretin GspD [Gammaproteobacteria bacterium]|nr:type II secretion system secretin GspD [Gammaproteobacteria bacterium]